MNLRLTLPAQWFLALVVGMVMGFVLAPMKGNPLSHFETPAAAPTPETAIPLRTLSGGWLVRLGFSRHAAPEILTVIYLEEARLTLLPAGENQIQILNAEGQPLYKQRFGVDFPWGETSRAKDEITIVVVLPVMDGGVRIAVQTLNGTATYDLPAR